MNLTHCKLKKKEQLRMLEFFVLEVTARSAANMLGIQANTGILFYKKLRQIISYHLAFKDAEIFDGSLELNMEYIKSKCDDKRVEVLTDSAIVFGFLKKEKKIFTVTPRNLFPIEPISSKMCHIVPDSIIYTDQNKSAKTVEISNFNYLQLVQPDKSSLDVNHQKAIQNFWNQIKHVLRKYNGTSKNSLALFLKECEFRFNYGTPKQQFDTLKQWCDI